MRNLISPSRGVAVLLTVASVASAQETEVPAQRSQSQHQSALVGRVVPVGQAAASWSVEGRIVEVNVEDGDRVKKGEVLARVDSRSYEIELDKARANYGAVRANLATLSQGPDVGELRVLVAELSAAQARLHIAESSFERVNALHARKAIGEDEVQRSESELAQARGKVNAIEARVASLKHGVPKSLVEKAKAELDVAEAEVRAVQLAVEETVLVAPVDGIVTGLQSILGDYVRPSRFCRILDDSRLRIEARKTGTGDLEMGTKFVVKSPESDKATEASLVRVRESRGQKVLILDLQSKPQGIRLGDKVHLELKD